MTYTPTNWVDGSTPLNRTNMMRIENELALLDPLLTKTVPLSTTIPGSPVDGQEVILVDTVTAPTWYWRMRYVAASAFAEKWIFVGGQAAALWYPAGQSMPGVWAAYNPTLTVPFTGMYTFTAQGMFLPLAAGGLLGLSLWINGAEDNDYKAFTQTSMAGNYTLKTDGIGKVQSSGGFVSCAGYTNIGCTLTYVRTSMTPVRLA